MNSKDTNALLRQMVIGLIDAGWLKTNVGKALLGDNGQGHVNHWLNTNNDKINDFGIKPLINIANQIKYDVHIVFVPKEGDDQFKEKLDNCNEQFVENLKNALVRFLSNSIPKPTYTRTSKSKIDKMLDELLDIKPVNNEEETIDQNDLAPEER